MKNVSSAFREELKKDNRNYIKSADITLKSGTVLKIDNSDLWQNGMKLDTATSSSNSFDLGAIITGQLTLTLNNIDEKFSDYDFTDCTATNVKVGLKLPDGTTESLSYGKFYLNEAKYNGSIITLTFYDSIYKFDQPYSKSSLSYPATLRQIVQDACSVCGVTLGTVTFDQDDFVVQERPNDSSITFRQVLQWVGQISCQYFYADVQGRLCMDWYDVGLLDSLVTDVEEGYLQDTTGAYVLDHNSEKINTLKLLSEPDDDVEESPYDDTMFHEIESFTSLTTGLDDIVITGIRIIQEVDSEDGGKENITIQYGTDGYVLGIEGNKFITEENASDVAAMIGIKTIGMQFRSFSANTLSDPTIEPGDVVLLIDRKRKRYKSIVTNNTFHPGNFQAFSCGAKSPIRNSSTRFSQITQVYTDYRKELSQQRTDIETALAELDDRIENSSGLFTTIEEQPDGSKKYFLHDKPLLSDSKIVWSMTAEAWGVSTDGGQTQNAGMTVDGDTIVRILTAVGINADWINTGALTIEKNGQVMFKADVDTGQVDIVANSFSLRGQTIDEIAQGEVDEFVNGVYAPTLNEIQNQIDQKTETWYQATDPSLQWTETEESALQDTTGADILDTNGEQIIGILEIGKIVHDGDLWKNSDTNDEYIYQDGQWIEMPIPDAVFDEIDGKARIFVTTPVPPYSERDLWMQGPDGDIMTCVHGRESGSFVSSDWEVKQKYTDDTAVGELDLALDKQGVFDRLTNYGEVKGIFLESDGQLYINASYLMTGILKVAQPGASGKETFYANMDTGEVRIVANSFSLTNGDTINSIAQGAVDDLDTSLDQQEVFNRLTNNGQAQGITLHQNGQLYINAEYIQSLILKVGGANNENGTFEVYNGNGVLVGKIDKDGAKFTNGNDWLQIQNSLMTGGYGGTTDGLLDLSANYSGGERHVVLESKTGDVILKSSGDFLVERPGTGQGTLLQSGNYQYLTDVGDVEITSSETEELRAIALGESVARDASNNPIDALALIRKDTLSKVFYEGDYFSYFSSHIITGWRFVSLTTPTTIASGYSWDLTANAEGSGIPYRTGTEYLVIPVSTGWGAVGSVDQPTSAYGQGSTSFTVTLLNNGSSAHTLGCTCLVLGLLSRDLSPLA